MRFIRSLDELFASAAHLSVLRTLWANRGLGLTGRAVAKSAQVSTAQTARILRQLQDEGIATSRAAGRAFLWRWNEDHHWASQVGRLFERELRARAELIAEVRETFRRLPVREVRLFGSIASGKERVDSDIDLLVVASDAAAADQVREALHRASDRFWSKFGNPLSPLILTSSEVPKSPAAELVRSIRENGIAVVGG